jgi:hypothetical protein
VQEKYKEIVEKAAKKQGLVELNRPRDGQSNCKQIAALTMSRLCIPVEGIAARMGVDRKTAKKNSENKNLVQSIKKIIEQRMSLSKGGRKTRLSQAPCLVCCR